MWKWIAVTLLIFGIWLQPIFVRAGTTADVTVTATGFIVTAPGGLVLTYINPYQVQIDWTKGTGADNTMVRGAVGRLPTSRTDGYLVYYGTGITANDTGVSFEETAAPIYYRAWSQNAGGVYEETGIWSFIEGGGMTLIALILLCLALSILTLWKPNFIFGLISGGIWIGLIAYTRLNPIVGTTHGDSFDTIFLLVCMGISVVLPLYGFRKERDNRNREQLEYTPKEERRVAAIRQTRAVRHGTSREYGTSPEEYQEKVHHILHPKKRR